MQRMKGETAMKKLKERVREEWFLDHPEQKQQQEAA
jgi:hypothetical protein